MVAWIVRASMPLSVDIRSGDQRIKSPLVWRVNRSGGGEPPVAIQTAERPGPFGGL